MKKLYVYADFNWLKEIELIGELGYESLRGSDSYSFTFNDEWLKKYGDLFLSDDLNNYPGQQYTQPGKDIFGCFSDALPDRWGRTLLLRCGQISAAEEIDRYNDCHLSIFLPVSTTFLEWAVFALRKIKMENL